MACVHALRQVSHAAEGTDHLPKSYKCDRHYSGSMNPTLSCKKWYIHTMNDQILDKKLEHETWVWWVDRIFCLREHQELKEVDAVISEFEVRNHS
jgi:hypothetical protein